VLPFVTYAHRKIKDTQLSEISAEFSVHGELVDLLPVYKKMGSLLVAKHKVEQIVAQANNISYPIIPPLKEAEQLLSSPHSDTPLASSEIQVRVSSQHVLPALARVND